MNYKLLALCAVFFVAHLGATPRGFAPYVKERGFSLDTRFEGVFRDRFFDCQVFVIDSNGYFKGCSGWFSMLGVKAYVSPGSSELFPFLPPLPNVQVGRYREDVGAVRLGLFRGFPGVGGDYWLIYDRFKLLTTLEFAVYPNYGNDYVIYVNWLNRLFLTDVLYIAGGISGFSTRESFGFLGLGVAF